MDIRWLRERVELDDAIISRLVASLTEIDLVFLSASIDEILN